MQVDCYPENREAATKRIQRQKGVKSIFFKKKRVIGEKYAFCVLGFEPVTIAKIAPKSAFLCLHFAFDRNANLNGPSQNQFSYLSSNFT